MCFLESSLGLISLGPFFAFFLSEGESVNLSELVLFSLSKMLIESSLMIELSFEESLSLLSEDDNDFSVLANFLANSAVSSAVFLAFSQTFLADSFSVYFLVAFVTLLGLDMIIVTLHLHHLYPSKV